MAHETYTQAKRAASVRTRQQQALVPQDESAYANQQGSQPTMNLPPTYTTAPQLLALQKALGNRAVQRLVAHTSAPSAGAQQHIQRYYYRKSDNSIVWLADPPPPGLMQEADTYNDGDHGIGTVWKPDPARMPNEIKWSKRPQKWISSASQGAPKDLEHQVELRADMIAKLKEALGKQTLKVLILSDIEESEEDAENDKKSLGKLYQDPSLQVTRTNYQPGLAQGAPLPGNKKNVDNTKPFPPELKEYDLILMRRGICYCERPNACGGIGRQFASDVTFLDELVKALNTHGGETVYLSGPLMGETGDAGIIPWTAAVKEWSSRHPEIKVTFVRSQVSFLKPLSGIKLKVIKQDVGNIVN